MGQDSTDKRIITTKAYGAIPVEERQLLHFPLGLYGFERVHNYALIDSPNPPFYWLQSTEDPQLAFIVINPYVVERDYLLDIPEDDLESIGQPSPEDLLVFAIVTIPQERQDISCNLQGPVIINRSARLGRQSISLDSRWAIKHYILPREGRA